MTPDDLTAEMFWSIVALVAVVYLAFEGAVWLGQRYAATDRGGEGAEHVLDPEPGTWDGGTQDWTPQDRGAS